MHKVVNVVTTGSVGDLGRIARALADAQPPFDIAAVGGGEAHVGNGEVGLISLLVRDDRDREGELLDMIAGVDLGGGRTPDSVNAHDPLYVTLPDVPGSLADCCERVGDVGRNIMSVLLLDLQSPRARIGLGFADVGDRDAAADALRGSYEIAIPGDHGDDLVG
jgi:hypothetical protein